MYIVQYFCIDLLQLFIEATVCDKSIRNIDTVTNHDYVIIFCLIDWLSNIKNVSIN